MEALGYRIKAIREGRGLTQREVAEGVPVGLRAYQHWEAGRRQPGMATVPTLARVMGVDPCDFFRDPPVTVPVRVVSGETLPPPAQERTTGDKVLRRVLLQQELGVTDEQVDAILTVADLFRGMAE
jgi:transcriptional regulator with XRE-family HTH domain